MGAGPFSYVVLSPNPRSDHIFRGLSLLAVGTLTGRQLELSHPLPKCPELLEKLTFPSTVPVTQEKQPQSIPSAGQISQRFATETGHKPTKAKVLPEAGSLVLERLNQSGWQPLALLSHNASHDVMGIWDGSCVTQPQFFFPPSYHA